MNRGTFMSTAMTSRPSVGWSLSDWREILDFAEGIKADPANHQSKSHPPGGGLEWASWQSRLTSGSRM